MIVDSNQRNGWSRGRIVDVTPGKDGQVRRAKVCTADGSIISRPAVKLALLEVRNPRKERRSPELDKGGNVKNDSDRTASTANGGVSAGHLSSIDIN